MHKHRDAKQAAHVIDRGLPVGFHLGLGDAGEWEQLQENRCRD